MNGVTIASHDSMNLAQLLRNYLLCTEAITQLPAATIAVKLYSPPSLLFPTVYFCNLSMQYGQLGNAVSTRRLSRALSAVVAREHIRKMSSMTAFVRPFPHVQAIQLHSSLAFALEVYLDAVLAVSVSPIQSLSP